MWFFEKNVAIKYGNNCDKILYLFLIFDYLVENVWSSNYSNKSDILIYEEIL